MNASSVLLILHALTTSVAAVSAPAPAPVERVDSSWFEDKGASSSGRALSPFGLFPIWENTATVLGHGQVYLGSHLLGVGLGDRLQIGTHPVRDVMFTPNLHAKFLVFERPRLRVAAHAEVLWMTQGASQAFTVSNFVSRLSTVENAFWVAPLGVTASIAPMRGLFVHVTTTAQGVTSKALPEPQVTFGVSAQLEWRPFEHHAFTFHAAEVGLHRHDYALVGASYRYQRWIFEGSIGYARRFYRDGGQGFPIAALGVEL